MSKTEGKCKKCGEEIEIYDPEEKDITSPYCDDCLDYCEECGNDVPPDTLEPYIYKDGTELMVCEDCLIRFEDEEDEDDNDE